MTADRQILKKMILNALSGKGAHASVKDAVAGLDWKVSGVQPEGVSHSIFQLLNHMIYWNQWVVKWLAGEKPSVPKHAQGGWPGAPERCRVARSRAPVRRGAANNDECRRGSRPSCQTWNEDAAGDAANDRFAQQLSSRTGRCVAAEAVPSGGLTW